MCVHSRLGNLIMEIEDKNKRRRDRIARRAYNDIENEKYDVYKSETSYRLNVTKIISDAMEKYAESLLKGKC